METGKRKQFRRFRHLLEIPIPIHQCDLLSGPDRSLLDTSDGDPPDIVIPVHTADQHLKGGDRKSTRLNSSHVAISYAVFCLKKKTKHTKRSCHGIQKSDHKKWEQC